MKGALFLMYFHWMQVYPSGEVFFVRFAIDAFYKAPKPATNLISNVDLLMYPCFSLYILPTYSDLSLLRPGTWHGQYSNAC